MDFYGFLMISATLPIFGVGIFLPMPAAHGASQLQWLALQQSPRAGDQWILATDGKVIGIPWEIPWKSHGNPIISQAAAHVCRTSRICLLSNFRTDCELQQRCAKFSLTSTWSTSPQVVSKRQARMHVFSDSQRESHKFPKIYFRILPAIFQSSSHFPGIPWWLMYFNSIQASAHRCLHCSSQQWQRLWWRGTSRAKCLPQLRDLEHVANVCQRHVLANCATMISGYIWDIWDTTFGIQSRGSRGSGCDFEASENSICSPWAPGSMWTITASS